MKRFYILWQLLMLWPALCIDAQVITTTPAIVQRTSSPIVITFHADRGNKGMAGMTARASVYAHTGV